jgi:TfoX/Sxy family transcriptional regulator of competence genes
MFGGIGFFLNGNMACGVLGDEVVLKVKGPEESVMLSRPGCRPFDFTGRPMRGFVMVAESACPDEDSLAEFLDPALRAASALPPKAKKPDKPAKPAKPAKRR